MFILLVFSGRMYVFGQAVSGSMDTDIMLMRQNGAPAFNCQFDSYTRFVPGVGVLGLKLCGLKCSELKGNDELGEFFRFFRLFGSNHGLSHRRPQVWGQTHTA